MSLEVPEGLCNLESSRRESEDLLRDLGDGKVVTLSIQGLNDLIEAHEIADSPLPA
jgi:hypothetical protein